MFELLIFINNSPYATVQGCICTESSCEQNYDEMRGNLCGALLPSCGWRWAYSFIQDHILICDKHWPLCQHCMYVFLEIFAWRQSFLLQLYTELKLRTHSRVPCSLYSSVCSCDADFRVKSRVLTACSWQIWVRRSSCSSLTALVLSHCWISNSISTLTCRT